MYRPARRRVCAERGSPLFPTSGRGTNSGDQAQRKAHGQPAVGFDIPGRTSSSGRTSAAGGLAAALGGHASADGRDIQGFVDYPASYRYTGTGDRNQDGTMNVDGIPLFVAALLGN